MADLSPLDIVRELARQRGRDTPDMLVLAHTSKAHAGERVSHLPIGERLAQAWITITGAPFRPHQAQALSALRRDEPFALSGDSTAARRTLHLLLYEQLLNDPHASVLLLVPEPAIARQHLASLRQLGDVLGRPLPALLVEETTPARSAAQARVLLTTPAVLHRRLLRHHDRTWQTFWARLGYVLLSDVEHYHGVAAAHLAGLLLRTLRLALSDVQPLLAATLQNVQDAGSALFRLSGLPWRIIDVHDTPRPASALAVWQSGSQHIQDAANLALALQREGYRVHLVANRLDLALLLPLLDQEAEQLSASTVLRPAQVHIFVGYPSLPTLLLQSLGGDTQLTLLLLGNVPLERTLARLPESIFNDPAPAWSPAPTNAYIEAQHLICAATECPLSVHEVEAWQATAMIARLQQHNQLVRLPDDNAAWQPVPVTHDPYEPFDIYTVGSPPILVYDTHGQQFASFDPAAFDRWGFLDAALPPGRGGNRVVERSEEHGTLTIRPERQPRRTFPLRHCTVNMRQREERDSRSLRGRAVGWGRVLIEEEITGYRETRPDNPPTEHELTPTLSTSWTAPALWIDLPMRLKASGQLIGWSLVMALPLRVLCDMTDVVPAYDAGLGRIYLVDAQPGGSGLAAWLYENLESVLPAAYDIALDCRSDALMEPAARVDMDWLLTLLGGELVLPAPTGQKRVPSPEPPARSAPSPRPEKQQTDIPRSRQESEPPASAKAEKPDTSDSQRKPQPAAPPAETSPAEPIPAPRPEKQQTDTPRSRQESELPAPAKVEKPDTSDSQRKPQPAAPPAETPPDEPAPAPRPKQQQTDTPRSRQESEPPAPAPAKAEKPDTKTEKKTARRKRSSPKSTETSSTEAAEEKPRSSRRKRTARPAAPAEQPNEPAPPDLSASATPNPAQAEVTPPDAAAILSRLQHLRQQKESSQPPAASRATTGKPPQGKGHARFQVGEQVFCRPYGTGVVQANRIENDQEMLSVDFPDHGVLDINPSVSVVRRVTDASDDPPEAEQTHFL